MSELEIICEIKALRKRLRDLKDKSVGFVPTMGYLHKGHASLIERAKAENDVVVVSIFVNPIQFGPNEDYDTYPRDLKSDCETIGKSGGDIVFAPLASEMYPVANEVFVDIKSDMAHKLCGSSRPGHFQGVMTVVSKLFNIVKPDQAYFGQKDAQQVAIIEKMVKDLNLDVKIRICPILREADGLAMSSRNVYLSSEERSEATVLYRALSEVKKAFTSGTTNVKNLREIAKKTIESSSLAEIEYIQILDNETLSEIEEIDTTALIAVAVKFGKTRLIDNCILGE